MFAAASAATVSPATRSYGQAPVYFEENRGQANDQVRYIARSGAAGRVLCRQGKLSSPLEREAIPQRLSGFTSPDAARRPGLREWNACPVGANYLLGSQPSKWHRNVPHFQRIVYHNVYPGIDVAFYGNGRHIEYDFLARPGADPRECSSEFPRRRRHRHRPGRRFTGHGRHPTQ